MKLKIRNTTDGLKVASCYIGADVTYSKDSDSKFIGVTDLGYFVIDWDDGYEPSLIEYEQITLDTEANQPCIYACMREGLKVEVEWEIGDYGTDFGAITYSLSDYEGRKEFLSDLEYYYQIKSIKILGEFEGVEVEE